MATYKVVLNTPHLAEDNPVSAVGGWGVLSLLKKYNGSDGSTCYTIQSVGPPSCSICITQNFLEMLNLRPYSRPAEAEILGR